MAENNYRILKPIPHSLTILEHNGQTKSGSAAKLA